MELSFIIPLFNRLDLTRPCVESLLASLQDGPAYEIIFVDDGSTDGTREWLASLRDTRFRMVLNETNRGFAHANNRGAQIARGRFLALVNSDLVFSPGWLAPMLRAFERHRDAGIVGNLQLRAATGELDHAGIIINLCGKPEHLNHSQGRLVLPFAYSERPAVTAACCLVPRELFNEHGGFDEAFLNGGEDVDLCFRVRARGRRVLVANRSVIRHHVSASPGRKARDEANSRILCRRWRDEFVRLGARRWPRAYLSEHWHEPRKAEMRLLAQAAVRWLRLVRAPAPHALALVERNLDYEEAHWRTTLGLAGKTK